MKNQIDIEALKNLFTKTMIESITENRDFVIIHEDKGNGSILAMNAEDVNDFLAFDPKMNYTLICKILAGGDVILNEQFNKEF